MAETSDSGLAGEPSFAKATDGRESSARLIQPFTEGREGCSGIPIARLRADRGAEQIVEVGRALRGGDVKGRQDLGSVPADNPRHTPRVVVGIVSHDAIAAHHIGENGAEIIPNLRVSRVGTDPAISAARQRRGAEEQRRTGALPPAPRRSGGRVLQLKSRTLLLCFSALRRRRMFLFS